MFNCVKNKEWWIRILQDENYKEPFFVNSMMIKF